MTETDLEILRTAVETARGRVQADPSRANLEAYDTASKMLAAYLEGEKEPVFENRIEVLKYLNRQGYAIQKSKLYADCKAGMLRMQSDKTVLESDVHSYIRKAGLEKPAEAAETGKDGALVLERKEAELERLQHQNKELQYKIEIMEGKYLLKTDAEVTWAIKIGMFESALKQLFDVHGIDFIRAVAGDLSKIGNMKRMFHRHLDGLLHELGNLDEIGIEIRRN